MIAASLAVGMFAVPLEFDPDDLSFNVANALYLAHASDIAYHRAPAEAAKERLGLDVTAFHNKVNRTRGFLGVCDTHGVLAFRGTEPITLPNWVTDAFVKLITCDEYEGRVHQGFSGALKRSWAKVEGILEAARNKPLFLTGHSMGGALAVLAACRLAKMNWPVAATYTFGAPRVGDRTFCAGYSLPTFRVVNRLDLVPEMPLAAATTLLPKKPRFTNEKILDKLKQIAERMPSYAHINTFVYIDQDGVITPDTDIQPWHRHAVARAIATRGKSFHEGITDHLISNYIRGLEGKVRKSQTGVRRKLRAG